METNEALCPEAPPGSRVDWSGGTRVPSPGSGSVTCTTASGVQVFDETRQTTVFWTWAEWERDWLRGRLQVSPIEIKAERPAIPCASCGNSGVIGTRNNDFPCHCPMGDRAMFNVAGKGRRTGAEIKRGML